MYFSTHCWAWKQIISYGQLSVSFMTAVAVTRSCSAFSTQRQTLSAFSSFTFIEHLSLPKRLIHDRADPTTGFLRVRRRSHNNIGRHINTHQRLVDCRCLFTTIAMNRHNNQKVSVAIRPGGTARIRSEQHDFFRIKSLRNSICHLTYGNLSSHEHMMINLIIAVKQFMLIVN